MSSQIIILSLVYSTVCSGAYQRKHQSFASLAFVHGIHRWTVNSPHKWPVTRKMFPFDDVIMILSTGTMGINFSEISANKWNFSSKKMHFKMSLKSQPFRSCLIVLTNRLLVARTSVTGLLMISSGLLPAWYQAIYELLSVGYSSQNKFTERQH